MIKKLSIFISALFFLVFFASTPSSWALMEALSIGNLANGSNVIIVGNVTHLESKWSENGEEIITQAIVEIEERLKGKVAGQAALVEYTGGEVDGVGLMVSDMPVLQVGERVVLFLTLSKTKCAISKQNKTQVLPTFNIYGLAQGKYSVDANNMATHDGFSTLGGDRSITDSSVSLMELKDKILKEVQ